MCATCNAGVLSMLLFIKHLGKHLSTLRYCKVNVLKLSGIIYMDTRKINTMKVSTAHLLTHKPNQN